MTMDINVTMKDNMQTNDTNTSGIGMRLKEARESMRLTEKDAAGRLHLNVKFIYAMENEDFENGPPPTFLRGYLRSYARLLCIPENEIEAALKQLGMAAPTKLGAPSLNIPISNQNEPYMRWLTYLVVIVLLVLVGMWWTSHSSHDTTMAQNPSATPAQTETANTNQKSDNTNSATSAHENSAQPHASTTTITVTKHDSTEPAQASTQKSITTSSPTTVIVNTNPAPNSTPEVTTEVAKPAQAPVDSAATTTAPVNSAAPTIAPANATTAPTPATITAPIPQPSVAPNAMIPAQTNNASPPGAPLAAGTPALGTTTPNPTAADKPKHKRHHRSNNYMEMELPEPGLYYY